MRDLDDLLTECDRHLLALKEAIGRCPQPLTVDHFAHRDAVPMVAEMAAIIADLRRR